MTEGIDALYRHLERLIARKAYLELQWSQGNYYPIQLCVVGIEIQNYKRILGITNARN